MKALSLNVGEWLLMLMDASDAIVGDLHETAPRRSVGWYWAEWCRVAVMTLQASARRHPLRAGWIGSMVTIAVLGTVQVTLALSQPCQKNRAGTRTYAGVRVLGPVTTSPDISADALLPPRGGPR